MLAGLAALSAVPLLVSPCMATPHCAFCRSDCFHCVEGFGACVTDEPERPPNCRLCPLCRLCVLCGAAKAACDASQLWVGACAAPLLLAVLAAAALRRRCPCLVP